MHSMLSVQHTARLHLICGPTQQSDVQDAWTGVHALGQTHEHCTAALPGLRPEAPFPLQQLHRHPHNPHLRALRNALLDTTVIMLLVCMPLYLYLSFGLCWPLGRAVELPYVPKAGSHNHSGPGKPHTDLNKASRHTHFTAGPLGRHAAITAPFPV